MSRVKHALRNVFFRVLSRYWRIRDRVVVHLLHIRKTGGTAVQEALRDHRLTSQYRLMFHGHGFRLEDLPPGDRAIVILRDPVSRFVSGFNSRRRKGRPRYFYEWTPAEARAFAEFPSASDLAEGLSSDDVVTRDAAKRAMGSISHVNTPLSSWLGPPESLAHQAPSILLVGFQETLDADFERLKELLDLPADCRLPSDPRLAHRAPEDEDRRLSDRGEANIRAWYAEDEEILEFFRASRG